MDGRKGETILSTGIDIGTTTTQLIFSRLRLQNSSRFGKAPRFEITDKEVVYRSPIYLTPLIDDEIIDEKGIREIISREYSLAGFSPGEVDTGAVIITGESVKKRNAEALTDALSRWAGECVVASAGPDLESILAGKGSGAEELSRTTGKTVANIDIGGGTSNICLFKNGRVLDTACLDIGGRAIQIYEGKVSGISPKIRRLGQIEKISLATGDSLKKQTTRKALQRFVTRLTRILEASVFVGEDDPFLEIIKTNKLLNPADPPEIITLSGGVADCFHSPPDDHFLYGDIGVLLGKALRLSKLGSRIKTVSKSETLNATVIGAGSYSMALSGSTISYRNATFPIKNIPILPVSFYTEEGVFPEKTLEEKISVFSKQNPGSFALGGNGKKNPRFSEIEALAETLSRIWEGMESSPMLLLLKEDMAKALGQALYRRVHAQLPVICMDSIEFRRGDYIDIGNPVAAGSVLPVIIKTLIFEGESRYDT